MYLWPLGFSSVQKTVKTAHMKLSQVQHGWSHSATDHSTVLVPLESLFVCLCKAADNGTMLQPLPGNPEMASEKPDISPSHQRSTTCQALYVSCKPLGVSLGFAQKARCCFFSPRTWPLLPLTDVCQDAVSAAHRPCPAACHSPYQTPACQTPGLASVLLIPADRWSCTVEKSVLLPVSLDNISWHESLAD